MPATGLVGRWDSFLSCAGLVAAAKRAGLTPILASIVRDYFPSVRPAELRHKKNVCAGARPAKGRAHYFTRDGHYGTLDGHGDQDDAGRYRLVGQHEVYICSELRPPYCAPSDPRGTFRYRIVDGHSLTLVPLITAADRRHALEHPTRFSFATWMVLVAYQGHPWERVFCVQCG